MRSLVFVVAMIVGCGATPRPSASPSTAPPPPDAGSSGSSGTTDDGANSSGGVPDAGPSGGVADAGPNGSSGSADGGTNADDCDGLRFAADAGPAAASHFIIVRDSTGQDGCSVGATTGTGTLALEMGAEINTLDFVTSSGSLLATMPTVGTTDFFGEQAIFFDEKHDSATFDLQAYSDSGATRERRFDICDIAEDPTGGLVGLKHGGVVGMDGSLATRWTAQCPVASSVALAVDRAGATLYVFDGRDIFGPNTMGATWIDAHGNAGEPFQFGGTFSQSIFSNFMTLVPRVGSGFFVQFGAQWIGQIDSFSNALSPPPAWLAARQNTSLHMVRAGKGYAVIPKPFGVCAQDVEVVSPAGMSCSTTHFAASTDGCNLRSGIAVGYDGTVIQLAPDPDPGHQEWFGPGTCYWQWWPGFFK